MVKQGGESETGGAWDEIMVLLHEDHENMSPTTANHHENEEANRGLQTHHAQAMEAYEAEQGGTVIWLESAEPHGGATYQSQIAIVQTMENGESVEGGAVGSAEGNAAPQHEGPVEENNGMEASPSKTGERKTLQQIGKIVPSGRSRPNPKFQNSAPYNRAQAGSGTPTTATGSPAPHRFEDPFEAFGRYVASLLRNLNSKRGAYRLQKDIIWQILQEQMREC